MYLYQYSNKLIIEMINVNFDYHIYIDGSNSNARINSLNVSDGIQLYIQ